MIEKEKQLIIIKLANGLEIVGEYISENEVYLTIKYPGLLVSDNEGEKLFPYSNYSTTGDFQKRFIIYRSNDIIESFVQFYYRYVENLKIMTEKDNIENLEIERNNQLNFEEFNENSNSILEEFFSDLKFPGRTN